MGIHVQRGGQLFRNRFLEALTRTSPVLAFSLYPSVAMTILMLAIYRALVPVSHAVPVFIAGFFAWTLIEYLIHRYLFHIGGDKPGISRFRYLMHGIHHDYPTDESRLIMPPVPWVIYTLVLGTFFYLVMSRYAFAFMPGVLIGYCCYVFVHFRIHAKNPPPWLRKLRVHHSLHHYRFPDHAFGVSTTFWDKVFGTMPPRS